MSHTDKFFATSTTSRPRRSRPPPGTGPAQVVNNDFASVHATTEKKVRFTVFAARGARLSKKYWLAHDGTVATDSGTHLAHGTYQVVAFDANDPATALANIGRVFEALPSYQTIALGVPHDGSMTGKIVVKARFEEGDTDAIPRALSHFGWPDGPGLLLLDGDKYDGLPTILRQLYPPFAEVALLCRPSASAAVIDPRTGARLKSGEHVYALLDEPARSKDVLEGLMRLAWCCGTDKAAGFLVLSKCGSTLVRGPIDASVGSPERLSYEGAGVVGKGLDTLPRQACVTGGKGMLCAAKLLEFAAQNAPVDLFAAKVAAAENDPRFIERAAALKAVSRETQIRKAVARGKPYALAAKTYDEASAAGTVKIGKREFIPLSSDYELYWPDGKSFTVGDIQNDPSAFHKRTCADPQEGLDYPSKNCAIIYTDGPEIRIYSRAHGDAFAYVAPLADLSVSMAEVFAQLRETHATDADAADDEPAEPTASASTTAAAEAWDPWRETPAPRLDHSLLPRVVRDAAASSARVSGADIDAFAIGYLVGLAACADTRLRITAKQRANDWSVPLLLWVLLLAPPSSMKSEVIKAARALAASLDMTERERHQRDLAMAEVGAMLKLESKTKTAMKQARDEAAASVTPLRQRVCGDITTEKYVNILGANPGGCAMFRDELSGWLGSLGHYTAKGNDGADREFYCRLRDGLAWDRQRMSSPDVHIAHCAGSFFSAVQLDRLLETKNLPTADGLLQRFLPLIMREARGYEDSQADDAKVLLRPVRDALAAMVPTMQRDPFGQMVAVPYKLTAESAQLYQAFADDMRLAARTPEPSREFGECLNKMGPMWLAFALLFHLIEAGGKAAAEQVPVAIARRVDALIREFFIPHAEQFYSLVDGSGSVHRMRSVATAILRCPKDEIVLRDVVHRCRVMREKARNEQVQLMQKFETFGWLTRLDHYGTAHPRWRRTSGLVERFVEELKREEAARAATTAVIKADAKRRKQKEE